jgi:hypothetical protein
MRNRVAPSFVRFGTFQLPASRGGPEDALVGRLADYIIRHHYPHLLTCAFHASAAASDSIPDIDSLPVHGGHLSREVSSAVNPSRKRLRLCYSEWILVCWSS